MGQDLERLGSQGFGSPQILLLGLMAMLLPPYFLLSGPENTKVGEGCEKI